MLIAPVEIAVGEMKFVVIDKAKKSPRRPGGPSEDKAGAGIAADRRR